MKTYNEKIATNDAVELIHLSFDKDKDAAKAWAKKNEFPWPTVLSDKAKKTGLNKYSTKFIPGYVLIDGDGNQLATGKPQCLAKIKEMTK